MDIQKRISPHSRVDGNPLHTLYFYSMDIFMIVWMGFVGACLGSFASVLIYRLYHDEPNILLGRSHCCQTGKKLAWWELIPIFSWLFLRGRSRHTGKRIPVLYLILEIVFTATFITFTYQYLDWFNVDNLWKILPLMVTVFFALVLFFYDAQFMIVDRRISWLAIAVVLAWAVYQSWGNGFDFETFKPFLIGGLIGFGFYYVQYALSKGRWVGAGDQELGLFMGLALGWRDLLLALFMAYIIGALFSCVYMMTKKGVTGKTALPMGAFLMPALILFLYDNEIWWQLYEMVFEF